MRVLNLEGTPSAMGEAFGQACRHEIHEFYRLRLHNAMRQALQHGGRDVGEAQALAMARACIEPTRAYDPGGFEELQGIARGADMPVEKVLAMNGLTDIRDVLAWYGDLESLGGCSSFIVAGDMTANGRALCGQTWDLATDNMPFVLGVVRKPVEGPSTRCLTTVGCLSLIGMNEVGIAVGTTNIRTTDSRPGVTYLSIIHKALSQMSREEAVRAVTSAERAGAHYYYVMDARGGAVAIETTALRHQLVEVTEGYYVHCNHCLVPAHAEIEGNTPAMSSHTRQARLAELIESRRGSLDIAAMQQFLADREHDENAICRDDYIGVSSNGAVVMEPQTPAMSGCHGLPCDSEWVDMLAPRE